MSEQKEEKTKMDIVKEETDTQDEKSDIKEGDKAVLEKNCSETAAVVSKSQMKKLRKRQRAKEANAKRKLEKKKAKHAKALAEGRDLEQEFRIQELRSAMPDTASKKKTKKIWDNKRKEAAGRFRICVDCSFESSMTDKEIGSLASQLRYCYSANKKSQNTVLYSVCTLTGKTNELLMNVEGFPDSWKIRAFNSSEKSLTEMYPNKSELIYLTSDSPYELDHLDDSKTYVIGGIVDRNRLKRATINKAENLGIATARLPIGKYLKLFSTNVLTINHVFEILLKYRENKNDWKKAMLNVLPTRKDIKDNVKEYEDTIHEKGS